MLSRAKEVIDQYLENWEKHRGHPRNRHTGVTRNFFKRSNILLSQASVLADRGESLPYIRDCLRHKKISTTVEVLIIE